MQPLCVVILHLTGSGRFQAHNFDANSLEELVFMRTGSLALSELQEINKAVQSQAYESSRL